MIHTLNRRADTHNAFCEDALFHIQRDEWFIGAVFDGCSTGINSHFASWLHMYTLREIIDRYWSTYVIHMERGTMDTIMVGRKILDAVRINLVNTGENLRMQDLEILSTIVLAIYNAKTLQLKVLFAGDGCVKANNEPIHRVTSGDENAPDYIARHTSMKGTYPIYECNDVVEFSICTDGIDQITCPSRTTEEIIDYLLVDRNLWPSDKMLGRKINILQRERAVLHDDVTIIRYTNEAL